MEGQGRKTAGEFQQFLGNAKGSLLELETHVFIATNLEYMTPADQKEALADTDEVSRLINGLLRSLAARAATRN